MINIHFNAISLFHILREREREFTDTGILKYKNKITRQINNPRNKITQPQYRQILKPEIRKILTANNNRRMKELRIYLAKSFCINLLNPRQLDI